MFEDVSLVLSNLLKLPPEVQSVLEVVAASAGHPGFRLDTRSKNG